MASEPVDIFRLRNNTLTRIKSADGETSKTTENGTFTLQTKDTSGVILTQSGKTIATIDERTGKISLEDTSFQVSVSAANKDAPMRIQVLSPDKHVIFSEKIEMGTISHLEQVTGVDGISGDGVFVFPNTGFSFVKNTASNPDLPDGGYIINSDHEAVAGISK